MIHSGVELLFDESTEGTILDTQAQVAAAGLGRALPDWGHKPHISLFGGGVPEPGFEEAVAALAHRTPALGIVLCTVATFGGNEGVLFFGPNVDRALLDLHSAAYDALQEFLPKLSAYGKPGGWAPHCTVSVGLDDEQWGVAANICRQVPLPVRGTLTRIAIHDVEFDEDRQGWDRIVGSSYRAITALRS